MIYSITQKSLTTGKLMKTLGQAALWGNTAEVKDFIKAGADVHFEADYPLRMAANNGFTNIVKILIDAGAEIHVQDNYPLRWASENGHLETVRVLLEAGADVTAWDNYALQWACINKHVRVAALLIQAGADPLENYNVFAQISADIIKHLPPEIVLRFKMERML